MLEDGLSPTDLQSLLLDLARTRAHRTTPASVRRRWQQDRFVQPSPIDPRRLAEVNLHLWRLLPPDFEGLALSPVTPLGTCAAVDAADQNRVLSTVRASEVVSDQTNVLALEAARQRLLGRAETTHLAASHRVLRNQQFSHRDAQPHFELFALLSSARDTGSARTEADMLIKHLRFWGEAVPALINHEVVVDLTVIDDAAPASASETLSSPNFRRCTSETLLDGRKASAITGPQRSRSSSVPTTALNQNSEMAASPPGQPLSQPTPRSDA